MGKSRRSRHGTDPGLRRGRPAGSDPSGSDEQALVRLFRVLTEEQFDYWIACLNGAVVAMGGRAATFKRDDRQKTISYWYLLMLLLEAYAAKDNPFAVRKGETWLSGGLVSMRELSQQLGDRYMEQTVRRYVFDLKRCGLIALDGRGGEAMLRLSAPAIVALADTIRQWVTTFREVDRRIEAMRVFPAPARHG
jgi:hypothetical protein